MCRHTRHAHRGAAASNECRKHSSFDATADPRPLHHPSSYSVSRHAQFFMGLHDQNMIAYPNVSEVMSRHRPPCSWPPLFHLGWIKCRPCWEIACSGIQMKKFERGKTDLGKAYLGFCCRERECVQHPSNRYRAFSRGLFCRVLRPAPVRDKQNFTPRGLSLPLWGIPATASTSYLWEIICFPKTAFRAENTAHLVESLPSRHESL